MPDEPKKSTEQPPRIGAKRPSIPPPPPKRPSIPPQPGVRRSSVPPPPPAAWSRARDDQPTEENRAAGHDLLANIRTAEMPSANEAVTEKIDQDDLRSARASSGLDTVRDPPTRAAGKSHAPVTSDDDGPIIPKIPQADIKTEVDGPIVPKIPGEELKTDVMTAPPDFGEDLGGKPLDPREPLKMPGNALVTQAFELRKGSLPQQARTGSRVWGLALLIALLAVAVLASIFWVKY